MHRSEAFLQAQKALIKANAEYRLQEQDVAEVICETMHIPTRQEVDDLHKTVTDLRRELRSLKKLVATSNTQQTKTAIKKESPNKKPEKKPPTKKPAKKPTTAKKPSNKPAAKSTNT